MREQFSKPKTTAMQRIAQAWNWIRDEKADRPWLSLILATLTVVVFMDFILSLNPIFQVLIHVAYLCAAIPENPA